MKVSRPRVIMTLFLLLVSDPLVGSRVTTLLLTMIVSWTILRRHFRVPKRPLLLLSLPSVLIVLGMVGSSSHYLRDVLKDGWYYTFPMLAVFAGYIIARDRRKPESLLLTFVAAGAVLSIWHLMEFFTHHNVLQSGDLSELRDQIGGGFMLSSVTPMIMFLASRNGVQLFHSRLKVLRWPIYGVTLLSVACAFSRTMVISALISLVAGLGWLTAKNKRGMIVIGAMAAILLSLNAVVPGDSSSFVGKFAQTREEISFSDFGTTADAIHHWRAYETFMATATYLGASSFQKAIGMGFGQLVDIGMDVELGGTVMREIPIFHNGYVYVLVKTGYVGVIVFLSYLARLYVVGARHADMSDRRNRMFGGLLMAMVGMVAVSTFVVSGWFNPSLMCGIMVLIGCLLSFLSDQASEAEIATYREVGRESYL
jgi:hypothetical protein